MADGRWLVRRWTGSEARRSELADGNTSVIPPLEYELKIISRLKI